MLKELIPQEDIKILSSYTPNNRIKLQETKKNKTTELQGEIDELTIVVGDFNTPLSEVGLAGSKSVRT